MRTIEMAEARVVSAGGPVGNAVAGCVTGGAVAVATSVGLGGTPGGGTATLGCIAGAVVGVATNGNGPSVNAAGVVAGTVANSAQSTVGSPAITSPEENNVVNAVMAPPDDSGGGGGGGGKVICTELCRNGVIEHDVWMADIRYSQKSFSDQTIRGYHLWGVPYVRLMRKYPAFAKFAAYPTRWFADDIAYRMGVRDKPNYAGWALRELAFRPICWSIGIVAKARDWQALWARGTVQAMTGARFA